LFTNILGIKPYIGFNILRITLEPQSAFVLNLVEERKDIALHEIAEALAAERGVATCPASVLRRMVWLACWR